MDRSELTPSADPVGLGSWESAHHYPLADPQGLPWLLSTALHLTDGHTEFQRGLERKRRRQKFVLIPFIVLHPSFFPDLVFRQSQGGLGSRGWAVGKKPRIRLRLPFQLEVAE